MEWIAPGAAVSRLLNIHYPGQKRGSPVRVRMNLIGALRAGAISWECERWSEQYIDEGGATFTRHEPPKFGFPPEFWRPEMARDNDAWLSGRFVSQATVNIITSPGDVKSWLGTNGAGWADHFQYAEGVRLDAQQVEDVLGGSGWSAWRAEAFHPKLPPARSGHYQSALINLIAVALNEPKQFRQKSMFELLAESFPNEIPDDAQLKELAKVIRNAIAREDLPPS